VVVVVMAAEKQLHEGLCSPWTQFNLMLFHMCAGNRCNQDEMNMLVPIIVGACLAGLIVIVLIAYFIGRRQSKRGYENV